MSNEPKKEAPAWVGPFLELLRAGTAPAVASRQLGLDSSAPYHRRRSDPSFREAWAAIRPFATRKPAPETPRRPYGAIKLDRFLTLLAETSNVSAAAAVADVSASRVYKLRREDPEFARRWYAALAEGYDNLEMELLGRLRAGDTGDKDKGKFDTAAALRCLAAHRESVAREKGRRRLAEEVITIASINAKIDRLRLNTEAGEAAMAAARAENAKRRRQGGTSSDGEA